ncbi:kinase-like domain-containing protein [Xylaria sp. FL1777]|nr:kinase-like domain-containing protein [Xylaria sp. FL1777]
MELRCYMTLDHPNILAYVHHELDSTEMRIYTEFCRLKDLESLMDHPEFVPHVLCWDILEGLASALARCHYGLKVMRKNGAVCRYTGFEKEWRPILHRDIKPGNVLIATHDRTVIPKLGDFGTSFKLEEDGKPPSSLAGTRLYWAPEVKDQLEDGRITTWSEETDIWGVGAVLYRVLTHSELPRIPLRTRQERIRTIKNFIPQSTVTAPEVLASVISDCLDPSKTRRPSALQLLAVVLKSDTSSQGLDRSESFWRVIAMNPDPKLASSVVEYFVSKQLPLLAGKTMFGLLETILIVSVAYKHCPRLIKRCHTVLCGNLIKDQDSELTGSTVFHMLAWLPREEEEIMRLVFEDSRWPSSVELSSLILHPNKAGFLPSAIAAFQCNKDLVLRLTKIE